MKQLVHATFCMHMQAWSCACIVISKNRNRASFLHLCWGLEWIPHYLGITLNPFFHTIKILIRYIFKAHRNPIGKQKDSLEIVNQKGSFSQNTLKSIFFWLGPFLALVFEFNITNYFLMSLWIDLTERNSQKSSLKSFSLRY